MDRDDTSLEPSVANALRALRHAASVPPVDPGREATLLAAFDAARGIAPAPVGRRDSSDRRDYWYLAAFAAAAVLFLAAALPAVQAGRHPLRPAGPAAAPAPFPSRDVPSAPPSEFVIVPGAAGLPRMESGTLVRMDVPASMLPSLGVMPSPGQGRTVTADFIVAQDGLPRAVRVVSPSE
jgi:hypothetical protein